MVGFVSALLFGGCATAVAHPAPFSYLDVHITGHRLSGTLTLHELDVAHDLGPVSCATTSPGQEGGCDLPALSTLLQQRLQLVAGQQPLKWRTTEMRRVPERDAIQLFWQVDGTMDVGRFRIRADLFPYDPNHQTFVNIFDGGALVRQDILSRRRAQVDFYRRSLQGRLAVVRVFAASGIHHIARGLDHVLFVTGLLLLGGTLRQLLLIVSAFTCGHSATLSLAAVGILDFPPALVEPAIALSIVYVGADNLLVGPRGRDARPWIAASFGLVHGFGFAGVLRDTGLPTEAIGWALASFNLGVELGQAAIVIVVASSLAAFRARRPMWAGRLATAGSVIIAAAGAYWFLERTL